MDALEPLASRLPYMVAVGNHEYSPYSPDAKPGPDPSGAGSPYKPSWGNFGEDAGGECGVNVARRFFMPGGADGGDALAGVGAGGAGPAAAPGGAPRANPPFWYAFSYGPVRFVVVSTEHDLSPGARQHAWLEAELAGADRCATPWLVLLLHRPLLVIQPHRSNRKVADHLREALAPLLQRHAVDVAVSGHVHSYFRSCSAVGEACVGGAAVRAPRIVRGPPRAAAADADGEGAGSGSKQQKQPASTGVGGADAAAHASGGASSSGAAGAKHHKDAAAAAAAPAAGAVAAAADAAKRHKDDDDDAPPQPADPAARARLLGLDPDGHGTVHVVIGSAGHELSEISEGDQDAWLAAAADVFGYGRFTADGGERLSFEYVESDTGRPLDSFELAPSAAALRLRGACGARGGAAAAPAAEVAAAR
jgi:hypothetical protein